MNPLEHLNAFFIHVTMKTNIQGFPEFIHRIKFINLRNYNGTTTLNVKKTF